MDEVGERGQRAVAAEKYTLTPARPTARQIRRAWTIALVLPIAAMALALVLHALKVMPFAPLVTSLQKLVILSFAAWLLFLSAKNAGRCARIAGAVFLCVPVVLFAMEQGGAASRRATMGMAELEAPPPCACRDFLGDAADAPRVLPLSEDELAALAWLEHVTGPLDTEEERELWDIGGTQHGIFSKRYHLAFAGYAAAAIGMRGDVEAKARAGKVIGNCLERMILSDVWCYSQSKSYWGYLRGQDGFDGWSLLWYEAWASDRRMATALWRRVRDGLDWTRLDGCGDERGGMGCCDPEPVPASVASVFLAAAGASARRPCASSPSPNCAAQGSGRQSLRSPRKPPVSRLFPRSCRRIVSIESSKTVTSCGTKVQ